MNVLIYHPRQFGVSSLIYLALAWALLFLPLSAQAQLLPSAIVNPSFETDFKGWSTEGRGQGLAMSSDAASGQAAAKIENKAGVLQQRLQTAGPGTYTLTVQTKGPGLIGVKIGERIVFERSKKHRKFAPLSVSFTLANGESAIMFLGYGGDTVRYDDVSLRLDESADVSPSIARTAGNGMKRLIAGVPPSQNFDLLGWYLSVPTDTDGNGRSDTISERKLAGGYEDKRFFFTAPDGGMTFRVPVKGFKTSHRTKFTRTELRQMLRRGDTSIKTRNENGRPNANNWVFSSAPQAAQDLAGAVDGVMEAELSVDHVTTTGVPHERGRVIIGQIHAKDDEPIRLYYRKLPHHERGSIYFAHERIGQPDDIYVHLIGDRRNGAEEPENGFKLGERFGYRIEVQGNTLRVEITQDGVLRASETLDMTGSGYDVLDDYMYFKAGVYNQNHTGDPEDYDQATFYRLEVSHDQ